MRHKALIVDDSKEIRTALINSISDLFSSVIEANNGLTAIKAFIKERPNFIITDIEMPSINGYRLISTIREMDEGRDIPIIMISEAKSSMDKRLMSFDIGASDFIIKPYSDEELRARVKALLRISELMTELKEKNALLEKLSITDDLTHLNNRRYFFDSLRERIAIGLRFHLHVACIIFDLDNFKEINDNHGHLVGDEVLKKLSRILTSSMREGELLARFGGEEFIMCIFNTNIDDATLAAERIREVVKNTDFSTDGTGELRVTISAGVAVYPQGYDISTDELVKAADDALYISKNKGRDRVTTTEMKQA